MAARIYDCKTIGSGTYEDPIRPAIGDLLDENGKPILTYSVQANKDGTMTVIADGDHDKAQRCIAGSVGTKPKSITSADIVSKGDVVAAEIITK